MLRLILALAAVFAAVPAAAQIDAINAQLDAEGKAELRSAGLVIEKADFAVEGRAVEALLLHASTGAKAPALLVIPGHGRSARDALPIAFRFARAGFTVLAVAQPGYGGSEGPTDFVGPNTIAAMLAGIDRLTASPFAAPGPIGIFGYSRGALAAAIVATRDSRVRAAVLGGGIYDFASARDQVMPGIRARMDAEAGTSAEAVRVRSPIADVAAIAGPVLIVHGEADANAPLAQARAMDAALEAAGKPHRLVIVPGADHALGLADIVDPAIPFLTEALGR